MTGYEVYKMYLALKNHFRTEKYDFFKMNGKVRTSEATFQKRNDVFFFKKLGARYKKSEDILFYLVSNFIESDFKGYIKYFNDDVYKNWRTRQESFSYKFQEEVNVLLDEIEYPYEQNFDTLFQASKGTHPTLLKRYFGNEVSLETMAVFENCLGYVKNFDKHLTDPMWVESRIKIIKYIPFLDIDCKKYRKVILETIQKKL